jgi:DNA-binding transcriptional ArsR family regulator
MKKSKTIGKTSEETKHYHELYLRAINSPIRRKILRAMKESGKTIQELSECTGLNIKTLNWHLNILEYGFCVEKKVAKGKMTYELTQEGEVVNYLDH